MCLARDEAVGILQVVEDRQERPLTVLVPRDQRDDVLDLRRGL
jgi:hypothetical protein